MTRVRPIGNRLVSMSDTRLLVIDPADRDEPRVTGELILARSVVDYLPVGDVGVQLLSPDWYGDGIPGALRVVSNSAPDTLNGGLAELPLDLYDGQLLPLQGSRVGLIRNAYGQNYEVSSTLEVYDLSTPTAPVLTARLELPAPIWSYQDPYSVYYSSSGGALVRTGDTLAWLESLNSYNETPTDTPDVEYGREAQEILGRLHVLDLSSPDAPSLTTLELDSSLFGLRAVDGVLYATHVEPIDESRARYFVDRFDVTDPSDPLFLGAVNVPGTAVNALQGGEVLVTLDAQWATREQDGYSYEYTSYSLRTVRLEADKAYALDAIPLTGYPYALMVDGPAAYVVWQDYYWNAYTEDGCYQGAETSLTTLSLEDPADLTISDTQVLPAYYGYFRALEAGHLFIDSGYEGLLVYDVQADPLTPRFSTFARTQGYVMRVRTQADRAYAATGMYGVSVFGL